MLLKVKTTCPPGRQAKIETDTVRDKKVPLSVLGMTLNEEASIRNCIRALTWVDELIALDSHSSDRTTEIARDGRRHGSVFAGPDTVAWKRDLIELATRLQIAEKITWTSPVAGLLKWGHLRAAEVFVLPSHQENCGIAVAEALACSLPVLISTKVNIWREVELEGSGCAASDDAEGPLPHIKTMA